MSSQLVEPDVEQVEKKSKKPSTSHLKVVPETRELRDKIRAEIAKFATTMIVKIHSTEPSFRCSPNNS